MRIMQNLSDYLKYRPYQVKLQLIFDYNQTDANFQFYKQAIYIIQVVRTMASNAQE